MKKDTEPNLQPCCEPSACCGGAEESKPEQYVRESSSWVNRRMNMPAGLIPVVNTALSRGDRLGIIKVYFGFGRMNYKVRPGLYGVGNPGPSSPVLVSANYKLSFDKLRKELEGLDAWILVLDTKGINVWCAAGKGTFGTDEVVRRVEETDLVKIVSHRALIVPQLGAPGLAAHEVTRRTGFKVIYGPVRAADIKEFLEAGSKATPDMRRVRFTFRDRLVLTPMELAVPLKYFMIVAVIFLGLRLLGLHIVSLSSLWAYFGAILAGCVLVPVLLPWIPGRAFAFKGWLVGMGWAFWVNLYQGWIIPPSADWRQATAYFLLLPAISAFLAMTFTGSSTYTSLSGVLREMRYAVPAMLFSVGVGLVLLAVRIF